MAKVPLYIIGLLIITLSVVLAVREGFIGFDEQGVPKEKNYPLVPCNPFSSACLPTQ
jgi:hypothetical protein